jgi:ribosomal protein S12 methylthiotransferase accessory factor
VVDLLRKRAESWQTGNVSSKKGLASNMRVDGTNVRLWNVARVGEVHDKAIHLGTHRVCPPEETLARVLPLLPRMGITRVAEVTQLDDLGVPVFQAIRPNSRNLSVSQGKGITRALAKVSAIMESIEMWHAEKPSLPSLWATVGEMAGRLPYAVYDLTLAAHHCLHDGFLLEWFPGKVVGSGEETFVPAGAIRLDFTPVCSWLPPTFEVSSNGLASGNTFEEALLHALYEVIERDTFARARLQQLPIVSVDASTVDGQGTGPLLEAFTRAGADFEIDCVTGPTGIACFEVRLISQSYPIVSLGYGCHLDREVALSRALTEAAQSRLTMISGARDDIDQRSYARIKSQHQIVKLATNRPGTSFHDLPSLYLPDLAADLQEVTRRLLATLACAPIAVDLTDAAFCLPVVFVIAPKLRFLETHK